MSDRERKIIGHGMLAIIALSGVLGALSGLRVLSDADSMGAMLLLYALGIPFVGLVASLAEIAAERRR